MWCAIRGHAASATINGKNSSHMLPRSAPLTIPECQQVIAFFVVRDGRDYLVVMTRQGTLRCHHFGAVPTRVLNIKAITRLD
jgi:hypothetical protein